MAATITHTDVAGFPPNPQAVGQFRVVVKDTRITSADANDAGDFVVTPATLGLATIFGVVDLHTYAGSAAADVPRIVDFVVATNTVTLMAADRAALDLDATDYAQARLAYIGL